MSELTDLQEKVDRLYEAIRAHNEFMEWARDELEKLFKAAGPMMSMAAPMFSQMMNAAQQSGAAPTPTPQAAPPAAINGGYDG